MDRPEKRRRTFYAGGGSNTAFAIRVRKSLAKKDSNLVRRGWKELPYDRLQSPYTGLAYPRYLARIVEELRAYFRRSERRQDDNDREARS